jgi:hypothetical protein
MTRREGAKQAEKVACLLVVELVVACKSPDVQNLVAPTCNNDPCMEMGAHLDSLSALRRENAEDNESFRPRCHQSKIRLPRRPKVGVRPGPGWAAATVRLLRLPLGKRKQGLPVSDNPASLARGLTAVRGRSNERQGRSLKRRHDIIAGAEVSAALPSLTAPVAPPAASTILPPSSRWQVATGSVAIPRSRWWRRDALPTVIAFAP